MGKSATVVVGKSATSKAGNSKSTTKKKTINKSATVSTPMVIKTVGKVTPLKRGASRLDKCSVRNSK